MNGAIRGLDYWYTPLVLYQDTQLQTILRSNRETHSIQVPLESTCKNQGSLTAELSSNGRTITKKDFSLDIKPALCGKRPWVCRLGLANWWMERCPTQVALTGFEIPTGVDFKLSIKASALNVSRCRISLQELVFQ
jgi:hypothetical protein